MPSEQPSERPVFSLTFSIQLNLSMAEQLLDLFDRCVQQRVQISRETWAFFKQLENWVGQKEEEESYPGQEKNQFRINGGRPHGE